MRKLIPLIVSVLVALLLCACSSEPTLSGEWKAFGIDATAEFYEDGTGTLNYNGTIDLEWEYNNETDTYSILVKSNMKKYETTITSDGTKENISFAEGKFYRFK